MLSVVPDVIDYKLHQIHRALQTPSKREAILRPDAQYGTIIHAMLVSLHAFKAGEISRSVKWLNSNLTLYVYDVARVVFAGIRPLLQQVLQLAPAFATVADARGARPLHLASHYGMSEAVELLLGYGASPLSRSVSGLTPIDEALHSGAVDVLGHLLRAVPQGSAREAVEAHVREYASLPGSAVPPRALEHIGLTNLAQTRAPSNGRLTRGARRPRNRAAGTTTCAEDGGWDVERTASDACELEVVSANITEAEYFERFFMTGRPVVIRDAVDISARCAFAKQARRRSTDCGARCVVVCTLFARGLRSLPPGAAGHRWQRVAHGTRLLAREAAVRSHGVSFPHRTDTLR